MTSRRVTRGGMAALLIALVALSSHGASARSVQPALSGTLTEMGPHGSTALDAQTADLAKKFEKLYPGTSIKVTIVPYNQYEQKLALLFASGQAPDIFFATGSILRYVQEGKVLPLDGYIKSDPTLTNPARTRTWSYDMLKYDNKHIYATQNGSLCSMQFYYNQDLFAKAHVAVPTNNWTWQDVLAAAQKLTVRQGNNTTQWGIDLGYQGWDGGWQSIAASNGATKIISPIFNPKQVNLTQSGVVQTWQLLQDMIYKYKVAPPPSIASALAGSSAGTFTTGKVAMVPDGCWQMSSYQQSVKHMGMTLMPKGSAGRVSPVWQANSEVISSSSKNKQLAWAFLRWAQVSPEANTIMSRGGLNCGAPTVIAFDKLYASSWQGIPGGSACVESLSHNTGFWQVTGPNWNKIQDTIITPKWQDFMRGRMTAKQLATTIQPLVNAALASGQ